MPPQQQMGAPYNQPVPKKHGRGFLIPFIIMSLLFIGALVFGIWAYAGMQDYKSNVDPKIQAAVAVAEQQTSSRKDNEFLEKEKNPLKTYNGPDTFGSIVLKYPKTWSAYVVEKSQSNEPISGYFHPSYVPDIQGETAYALRVQVVNRSYDQELKSFDSKAQNGKVKVAAYKPKNVSNVSGARVSGEINTNEEGTMVLLPLRDKTLKIWTESTRFNKDFDNIILANLTFIP